MRPGLATPLADHKMPRRGNEPEPMAKHMSEMQKEVTVGEIANLVEEAMYAGAQVQKDNGRTEYKAEIHRALAAYAMAKALGKFNLPPTAANLRTLLAMVDNHSAWRQKFEKKGIFPKKEDRPASAKADDYLAQLEEEGV